MMEQEVLRNSHLIDPTLHVWGWEIPVYLFLGGVTAGVMVLSGIFALRVPLSDRSRALRIMPMIAPLLLSLGMLALFLDLEHKRHVVRFYFAFRLSSPMSWGAWILLLIFPASVLTGLANVTRAELGQLRGAWLVRKLRATSLLVSLHGLCHRNEKSLNRIQIALGIALGAYTGVLLGSIGARAAWNSLLLAPLFLASGVSTGAALMMLFPLRDREHRFARGWDITAIGLELGILALFFLGLWSGGGEAGHEALALFFGGRYTAAFWSLVVGAGLLVPLALESIEAQRKLRPTLLAPVLLLGGGLALRWIIVLAGQA